MLALVGLCFLCINSCRPLPPKPLDLSSPSALAEVLVETLVKNKGERFSDKLTLRHSELKTLVGDLEKKSQVSVNPNFIEQWPEKVEILAQAWSRLRSDAEFDGVLWQSVTYYGCRYKMMQRCSRLPTSMSFEIFIEVGGFFYQIDISSLAFEGNYYVFDSLIWRGEVDEPVSIELK